MDKEIKKIEEPTIEIVNVEHENVVSCSVPEPEPEPPQEVKL